MINLYNSLVYILLLHKISCNPNEHTTTMNNVKNEHRYLTENNIRKELNKNLYRKPISKIIKHETHPYSNENRTQLLTEISKPNTDLNGLIYQEEIKNIHKFNDSILKTNKSMQRYELENKHIVSDVIKKGEMNTQLNMKNGRDSNGYSYTTSNYTKNDNLKYKLNQHLPINEQQKNSIESDTSTFTVKVKQVIENMHKHAEQPSDHKYKVRKTRNEDNRKVIEVHASNKTKLVNMNESICENQFLSHQSSHATHISDIEISNHTANVNDHYVIENNQTGTKLNVIDQISNTYERGSFRKYEEFSQSSINSKGILDSIFGFLDYAIELILFPFFRGRTSSPLMKSRSNKVSYKRFQLVRLRPRSEVEIEDIKNLEGESNVQFWTPLLKNRTVDIVIPPELTLNIKEFFKDRGIHFTVLSNDLEKTIAKQNPRLLSTTHKSELKLDNGHSFTWTRYHRYSDFLVYMEYLANAYPQIVELMPIGKSSEGRILKVVKISSGASTSEERMVKPAIWIDGGMHAREWISPAVAMFIVKQLVERYETFRKVVDKVDWYILPVVNPDGYEYTHTNDRLWRKSRSNHEDNSLRARFFLNLFKSSCEGVDLNRNWDFHWGESGSSDDPCHDTYAGPKAFSEPETRAVADFILDHKERIQVYLTLHAYSQMWLIPWSYTKNKIDDYEDLMFMGKKAIEALKKVNGIHYDIGGSTSLLYPTAGSSDDWAKGKAGIKYSYTVELRDKGSYGFLLPASQILPTAREMFAAVRAIARALA